MKIISQFRKLQEGSKIRLRFRKHTVDVFNGYSRYDYGIEIILSNGRSISKEYEKFTLMTQQREDEKVVIIRSLVENDGDLEVFAYLIEYVLFELGKKQNAAPSDIKKFVDDWLNFSLRKPIAIPIEKQIGLIGELQVLHDLVKEFPDTNQINNWQGPVGSKIDFIFSDKFGLEVKSRIQPFNNWITISSVEQLDNDLFAQHIAVCDFLQSDSGKTLRDYVDNIITQLDDRDKANELIEKMQKINYDYFNDYSNLIKVNLFQRTIYNTKVAEFPCLSKPVDLRIDKIKYDININGLKSIDFEETISIVRSQQE
jgi:hypothetical protein